MLYRTKSCFNLPSLKQKDESPTAASKGDVTIFKGLFLGGLSGLFFASTSLLVKYIDNLPTEQLVLIRFTGIFFATLPEAVKFRDSIFGPKKYRLILFIRGVFAATNILLSYTTFRLLPLGEASVIIFSYPALVAILAKIFLKEPCGIFQGLILILTVIGISFVAKLPAILEGKTNAYTKETTYGLLAGLGSVALNACQVILVRRLKTIDHVVLMFNLGWIAILATFVLITITGNIKWHDCGLQALLIILLASFNYGSQILFTLALKGEFAAPVTIMRSGMDIMLSFVFQIVFFNDIPERYNIVGATILGISFLLSGIKKWASCS